MLEPLEHLLHLLKRVKSERIYLVGDIVDILRFAAAPGLTGTPTR